MKKVVFFDVDGTLTMQNGLVPKSAIQGIQKLRENGIDVYLCTGRSMSEITSDIRSIGFNGYIAAGGGYIEKDNDVLHHQSMPKEDVIKITDYFNEREVGYYLESNEGLFSNKYVYDNIKKSVDYLVETKPHLFMDLNNPYPTWFTDILDLYKDKEVPLDKINKMSFVSVDHPFSETYEMFKDDFEVYHSTVFEFGAQSGEIGLKDIDKNFAIKKLISTYDEKVYTYAYGDGLNDIAMFEAVDYSIAMRNAKDELKKVASEVIGIAEEDAIYESLLSLSLIK